MRRFALYIITLSVSWLLAGCASSLPSSLGGECYNKTLPILLDSTDLKALFQDIAAELCVDTCTDCPTQTKDSKTNTQACQNQSEINSKTVLVTDFADLQSFQPNQSGLLMGELMRGSLNKVCCYKIIQAEFAKYFKLSENGLVVLTRKVAEIKKDDYSNSDVIVGTYNYLNNNKILIFVRKINIETGKISKMVTREISYSCVGRSIVGYTAK
jgi:hypothetical protein